MTMFVAYEKKSTRILQMIRQGIWQPALYETKGACTRAINKSASQGRIKAEDYAILTYDEFQKIEKTEIRIGLVGSKGVEFVVPVNTPWSSGPWSDAYWQN